LNEEVFDSYIICRECDLLSCVTELPAGHKAICPRCGYVLTRAHKNALNRILVFGATAVICLLFSNLFDYVNMSVQGQVREISLLETVQVLFELEERALAVFMSVIIIALPTFFVGVISWLAISIKLGRVSERSINLLRIIAHLRFWNMAEIFFLGILISMVKVSSMVDVEVGLSFWAYALFNVFLIAALANIDRFQLTRAIKQIVRDNRNALDVH
jgi:paraquat-inducible protein A